MEYRQREYPPFSACGLHCGLCPRYYTIGTSKCPGCAGEGFSAKHPPCGVLSCSQRKEIEYCHQCGEFPCPKYNGAGESDSFITHLHQMADMEKAKRIGMDAYAGELDEKMAILQALLGHYDDGRRKSFFCTAVNLLELRDVKNIMERLDKEVRQGSEIKERAALAAQLLQTTAAERGVSLQLRKKAKA